MLLAVLFSCFAYLANAQISTPSGLVLNNIYNGNVGIRTVLPLAPFHIFDGFNPLGGNYYSGIRIHPGDNPAQIAQMFALKDFGYLINSGTQDSGRGQSGILLGSGFGDALQKATFFSKSFDFNFINYITTLDPTVLNGATQGTKVATIDDILGQGPHLRILGGIKAKKVTVTQNVWADYVFADDFKLRPLAEVATFIGKNKHLPDVPSQAEITANGLDLGEMQKIHMQKIEELTLYLLEQEKRIQELERKLLEISKKK